MSRYAIGIDPGWSGGVVVLRTLPPKRDGEPCTHEVMGDYKIPDGELGVWLMLNRVWDFFRPLKDKPPIALEKVGGYVPGSGGNIGSAMFEFGRCYGCIVTCLHAMSIRFSTVTPGVWQSAVGIPTRGKTETKEQHKRKLRDKAKELFPDAKPTLKTADAMLLAYYAAHL